MLHHRLTKDQRALLHTNHGTLKHDPVFIDFTVVNESSHGGDAFLGQIRLGLATGLVVLLTDAVHLLVEFRTVEISVLTGTSNRGRNTSRMPRSDTSDLSQTTVSLSRKTSDTPTGSHTLVTTTLGNTNNINVLVLVEDGINGDFLFEQALGKVHLGSGISTVDLDLHDMSLLQPKIELLHLGVGNNTDNGAEFLDAFQLGINVLAAILRVLLGILGEGLLLGSVPVLVQASLELFVQVLGKDSCESAKAIGGFDVSDHTYDDHGGSFNDRNGIDDFTLVHEGTRTIHTTDDVSHTGFVSSERGKVRGIARVVLGEGTNAS
mmetsp:Transcript_7897/g.14616  ORF Transcript_7897/g.14616 Transcript_7897/m.14616 type:complete len:321 (-) Transcript_7897:177-1139(-)